MYYCESSLKGNISRVVSYSIMKGMNILLKDTNRNQQQNLRVFKLLKQLFKQLNGKTIAFVNIIFLFRVLLIDVY
jgi:UDP-glucose 6-dehydrogenase